MAQDGIMYNWMKWGDIFSSGYFIKSTKLRGFTLHLV